MCHICTQLHIIYHQNRMGPSTVDRYAKTCTVWESNPQPVQHKRSRKRVGYLSFESNIIENFAFINAFCAMLISTVCNPETRCRRSTVPGTQDPHVAPPTKKAASLVRWRNSHARGRSSPQRKRAARRFRRRRQQRGSLIGLSSKAVRHWPPWAVFSDCPCS